jgi:hypothetical protein
MPSKALRVPNWTARVDFRTTRRWVPTIRVHVAARTLHVALARAEMDAHKQLPSRTQVEEVIVRVTKIGQSPDLDPV